MDNFRLKTITGLVLLTMLTGCLSPSQVPSDRSDVNPEPREDAEQAALEKQKREQLLEQQRAERREHIEKEKREQAAQLEKERLAAEAQRQADIEAERARVEQALARQAVEKLCDAIGNKLGSVSVSECHSHQMTHGGFSTDGQSIAYREFLPVEGRKPLGKVLVLGGIHGDEFSSVSVVFKWLAKLDRFHSGLFHWRVVPTVNPDGLLRRKSQRQNTHGVDLNRNFPTTDWSKDAQDYWINETKRNPRRNPGQGPASEIETRWIVDQIESFQPDVIISMHAPYHLVDYDGPPTAPENLGGLYLRKLGVYPGSLGNYVGVDMNKPIVTVELKSAGIMPRQSEIDSMWNDLVGWLRTQLSP